MRTTRWLWGIAAAAAACGTSEGDDAWGLAGALPGPADVTPAAPGMAGGAGKAPLEEPAALVVVTRRTRDQLVGLAGPLVGHLEALTREPPSASGEDFAVWGPITPPLSPLDLRLVVRRTPSGIAYHLDARPRLAAGLDFAPILAGEAAAGGDRGELRVDLARLRELDPVAELPPVAALRVGYARTASGATLEVDLDGAHYAHVARADGGGALALEGPGGAVHTRWRADGAGRGEGPGIVECWDRTLRRVFVSAPDGAAGDPAACVDVP